MLYSESTFPFTNLAVCVDYVRVLTKTIIIPIPEGEQLNTDNSLDKAGTKVWIQVLTPEGQLPDDLTINEVSDAGREMDAYATIE